MSITKNSRFRPWVQKVMPTVFDDSLTYYELLSKVIGYLNQLNDQANEIIDFMDSTLNEQTEDIRILRVDFNTLKEDLNESYKLFTELINGKYDEFIDNVNESVLPINIENILDTWFDSGRLADIINNQVFNMKADKTSVGVNVEDFDHLKVAVANGYDYSIPINSAIDYAIENNIGSVVINKMYTVSSPVIWKAGVMLRSENVKGYYQGMNYFASSNTGKDGGRIQAIGTITGGVVQFQGDGNKKGSGMEFLIIDANKSADYCLTIYGGDSLTEHHLLIEKNAFQGGVKGNIRMTNTIANIFNFNTISASDGWGIECAYGVSDSMFTGNYIHTNTSGGIYFTGGSFYNQIIGGKIEDNYGRGISVSGANGGAGVITVTSTQFHRNNRAAIGVQNGGEITVVNATFGNNGLTQTGNLKCHLLVDVGGGTINLVAPLFAGGVEYNVTALYGTIHLSSCNLPKGSTDYYYKTSDGKITFSPDVKFNGKAKLLNYGARKKKISVDPNVTRSVTFEDVITLNNDGYFGFGEYDLRVSTCQFPNTLGGIHTGEYKLYVGGTGDFSNENIKLITKTPPTDNTWIGEVTVSLGSNKTDLIVNITGGANVGATSGMKDFHVYLVDIGNTGHTIIV